MHVIAVFCAHPLEQDAFLAALTQSGATKMLSAGPGARYRLPIGPTGHETLDEFNFVVNLTDQGNGNAEDKTREVLQALGEVDLAMFVGTCGALKGPDDLPIGTVVVPNTVLSYYKATSRDKHEGSGFKSEARNLVTSPDLVGIAARFPEDIRVGLLVTSDIQMEHDAGLAKWVRDKHNMAQVVEMEAAGFLTSAHHVGAPAVVVRAVMDHIGDRDGDLSAETQKNANQKLACRNAAAAALRLAEEWRVQNAFDHEYARKVHERRNTGQLEENASRLVHQLIEAVTGNAVQQHPLRGGTHVDIEFPGGVIEVERDLRKTLFKKGEGQDQLEGYLADRASQLAPDTILTGYVTDGVDWAQYEWTGSAMSPAGRFTVTPDPASTADLVEWIRAGLSPSRPKETPTPERIEALLGASSQGCIGDRVVLDGMWRDLAGDSEAMLKRSLWARSLRTALGTQFTDDDALFIDHTYLVLLAELIANMVVGVDIVDESIDVTGLVTGRVLSESRHIRGVVEEDFFDWPIDHPQGQEFIRRLARRVAQFNWDEVEHDVLKFLYESVIGPETRRALGEYYTPDWLAKQVVDTVVVDPLKHRVLDPSCGSGTFLFHAVQKHLEAAESAGMTASEATTSTVEHVYGFDLHPVAVALARVTYLLAIGSERLTAPDRPTLQVPVYLGDSLRWGVEETADTLEHGSLKFRIDSDSLPHQGQTSIGDVIFSFPAAIAADPAVFDELIDAIHTFAHADSKRLSRERDRLDRRFDKHGISDTSRDELVTTANTYRWLVSNELDGIWKYYLRNQARPAWLAMEGNGVDYLVGNPPWLRYSHMPAELQEPFKAMSQARGLWGGVVQARDLSGLFVARVVELYLKEGGSFGFVMPDSVPRGKQFAALRTGKWTPHHGKGRARQAIGRVEASIGEPWDVGLLASPPFPVPSSVILGSRSDAAEPMPDTIRRLKDRNGAFGSAPRTDAANALHTSPYAKKFRQGAVLVPRALTFVEVSPAPPGAPANLRTVTSFRTNDEKMPWKAVRSTSGTVEASSVFPTHLGSTILPYRPLDPWHAVLPIVNNQLNEDDLPPGADRWWDDVNDLWAEHRSPKDTKPLLEARHNYFQQLDAQLPLGGPRVVYSASGNQVAAAVVSGDVVIEHKLYWAPASSAEEADYLCAILNSETLRERTEAYQSRGLFGPKDFDKYVFVNPIPTFDATDATHAAMVALGQRAAKLAAAVVLDEKADFKKLRGLIRLALRNDGVAAEIDVAVAALLDADATKP